MNKYKRELKSEEYIGCTRLSLTDTKRRTLELLLKAGELEPSGGLLCEFIYDKRFSYISSVIEGCATTKNIDLLYLLYKYMLAKYEALKDKMMLPGDEKILEHYEQEYGIDSPFYSNKEKELQDVCTDAISFITEALAKALEVSYKLTSEESDKIIINSTRDQRLEEIIATLSKCAIDECRIVAASYTTNIDDYIEDENADVATIAQARIDFFNEHSKYTEEEKKQNAFLTSAIENGMINFSTIIPQIIEDRTYIENISSPFIVSSSAQIEDCLRSIPDKRVLASFVKKGIDDGTITLIEGMDFLKKNKGVALQLKNQENL